MNLMFDNLKKKILNFFWIFYDYIELIVSLMLYI